MVSLRDEESRTRSMDDLVILASADVHGDRQFIRELREEAEEKQADLILLAGDIFTGLSPVDGLLAPLAGLRVALLPGNHDPHLTVTMLAEEYAWYSLHGRAFRLGPAGIFGYSAVNIGPEAIDEDAILHALEEAFQHVQDAPVRIMVTHVPPTGTVFERIAGMQLGSHAVREAVERFQPDLVVTAHVHEARGLEDTIGRSRIVNVSRLIRAFRVSSEGVDDA